MEVFDPRAMSEIANIVQARASLLNCQNISTRHKPGQTMMSSSKQAQSAANHGTNQAVRVPCVRAPTCVWREGRC
jgi:hypothetical protein